MATLSELSDISSQPGYGALEGKIRVAAIIKAQVIADSQSPTAEALAWARNALSNPATAAKEILPYVIAKNNGVAISASLSASDSAIQTNVDAAVDNLFGK